MFSLQTKRAICSTKTPFQLKCKLHDNLIPLDMSDGNVFKKRKLKVFVLCYEAKILQTTFWRPDFSIWRLKKKIQSPLGDCIKKLISDPVLPLKVNYV